MTKLEALEREVARNLQSIDAQLEVTRKRSERRPLNQRRFMLQRLHDMLQVQLHRMVARAALKEQDWHAMSVTDARFGGERHGGEAGSELVQPPR